MELFNALITLLLKGNNLDLSKITVLSKAIMLGDRADVSSLNILKKDVSRQGFFRMEFSSGFLHTLQALKSDPQFDVTRNVVEATISNMVNDIFDIARLSDWLESKNLADFVVKVASMCKDDKVDFGLNPEMDFIMPRLKKLTHLLPGVEWMILTGPTLLKYEGDNDVRAPIRRNPQLFVDILCHQ